VAKIKFSIYFKYIHSIKTKNLSNQKSNTKSRNKKYQKTIYQKPNTHAKDVNQIPAKNNSERQKPRKSPWIGI